MECYIGKLCSADVKQISFTVVGCKTNAKAASIRIQRIRRIEKSMNSVVIVAGGSGSRKKSETPKQFIEIKGKPLILWTEISGTREWPAR